MFFSRNYNGVRYNVYTNLAANNHIKSRVGVAGSRKIALILDTTNYSFSQTQVIGKVIDTKDNCQFCLCQYWDKGKNIGTVSRGNGSFAINISSEFQSDSLTFLMAGYHESSVLIKNLVSDENVIIKLREKTTQLGEVVITGEKLV